MIDATNTIKILEEFISNPDNFSPFTLFDYTVNYSQDNCPVLTLAH